MSRFWAAASSSEDEKGSDDESVNQVQTTQKQAEKRFAGAFDESDSDSEDEVRVVKSQKDRRWDSIREGIARIRNARKNSDWPMIQDEFSNVNKLIEKSKMLILQSGIPPFYIKMLAEVEDHVQLALKDKDAIKKMKPVVSRALNQMKLQVRKHNDSYKTEIADFRANPDKYEEPEEDEESSSESDSDSSSGSSSDSDSSDSDSVSDSDASSESEKPKAAPKPAAKKLTKAAAGSDSEEDSLFGAESDDSSSSSESEDDTRKELKGRARWLKKVPAAGDTKKKDDTVRKERVVQKKKEYTEATPRRPVSTYVEVKLTEEELDRKLSELLALRGKRNTDPREALRQLEVLTKAARVHGPRKEIPVLMHLISNMLDLQRSIDDYLEHHQWRTCYRSLYRVVNLLESNKKLSFAPVAGEDGVDLTATVHLKTAAPSATDADGETTDPNVLKVAGSLASFIVRLQDEYTKSLQQINPHTKEYLLRLSDEAALVELAEVVLGHYLRIGDSKSAALVSQLIVDHMYYKHDSHAVAVRRAHLFNKTWGRYGDLHPACVGKIAVPAGGKYPSVTTAHPASFLGNPTVNPPPFNPGQRLQELCTYIFKYGDKRSKTHALLALVHHHALHDRYYKARDLLLISHISEFADKFDIKTQILYNRAIATLGLCAFRLGLYQKAHDCLTGLCSGRVKELLAQGLMRWTDRDPEQEKIERRRQMLFHMHINPDLLELCHLASAMILELPHLARSSNGSAHQTVVSRIFRKYLSGYTKQVFRGPPENTREHVLAATKALLSGEWQKAIDLLMGLEVWKLIPNDGAENAKALLRARIKEEAVRTYLLLNGDHYESLSLAYLVELFGMEEAAVRRIISRMIFNKELSAAWDTDNVLVMYRTEPSALQTLSQGLAEKLAQLLESNERILDPLVGVYGYKEDWNARGGDGRAKYAGGDANRGGKFRSGGGGYKSGGRPVLARQPNQQRGGRDGGKGRPGGAQGQSQSGGAGGATRNAWTGAARAGTGGSGKAREAVATQPVGQQSSTPRKWDTSA